MKRGELWQVLVQTHFLAMCLQVSHPGFDPCFLSLVKRVPSLLGQGCGEDGGQCVLSARPPGSPLSRRGAVVLLGFAADVLDGAVHLPLHSEVTVICGRNRFLWEFSGLKGDGWAPLRHTSLINKP